MTTLKVAGDVRHLIEDDSNPQIPYELPAQTVYDNVLTFVTTVWRATRACWGHDYQRLKDLKDEEEGEDDEPAHKRLTNLWRLENIAIPMSYFSVGIAYTFLTTPVTYYAVDTLDADSQLVNTLSMVMSLPWGFKLLFGLLSDCQPIFKMRRKPYFMLGWMSFVACNLLLAFLGTPDMGWLVGLVFLQTCGYLMSDVMADALIVERSKLEPGVALGTLQATSYILRYFGNIVGNALGTMLYNKEEWGWGLTIAQIFFLNAAFPVFLVAPFMWFLSDPFETEKIRTFKDQCIDIWDTVQKKSVWLPMVFIYIYNVSMVPNAAWTNFLIEGLSFTDWMIGVVSIAGSVFAWLGVLFYRYYLTHQSWRLVYIWSTAVLLFFSCLQLMLIFQINTRWGISNLWFSLGDTAASDFAMAIAFLPMVKMFLCLCPEGAEGTTYAMLTTYGNVAYSVSYSIGTLLAYTWDVSNDALESGEWSGMWKLTLLTSVINPLSLIFIGFLPESTEHQKALQKSEERSWWGGFFFLLVLAVSLLWSVTQTIVETYA